MSEEDCAAMDQKDIPADAVILKLDNYVHAGFKTT